MDFISISNWIPKHFYCQMIFDKLEPIWIYTSLFSSPWHWVVCCVITNLYF